MERSVSRARSPSPGPSMGWRGENFPLTREHRNLKKLMGDEETDFSERHELTAEDIIEIETEKANEALRKAQEHFEEINRMTRDKKVKEMIDNIQNMINASSSYISPIRETMGDILGSSISRAGNIAASLGESAFRSVLAPGAEAYYSKVLRESAVGTPEYDEANKMLQTAKLAQEY